MGFTCGIIGLPNVGKSTLFNSLTLSGADASNYPFCTIDPNIGIVAVPDSRLSVLASIYRPDKVVPTTIEFVDIAGLVRGASKGEGLGNKFLSHIREVDAIAHVVRCFEESDVVHVDGSVNPARDIDSVETELILKDLETVERREAEAQKKAKSGEKRAREEAEFYARLREHLLEGRLARYFTTTNPEEKERIHGLHLLTRKPVMYVCNVNEGDVRSGNEHVGAVRRVAAKEGANVVIVSAAVEAEVAELPEDERKAFLIELGMEESGLARVIREGYDLLHLLTFFTAGPKEVHAWTVPKGTTAANAAGRIHSDFEAGFIRAEIIRFDDILRCGSEQGVREAGMIRTEGRDYIVQDGDISYFRFRV